MPADAVEAFHYLGEFPLGFLADNEYVRMAPRIEGAVDVHVDGIFRTRLHHGQWLVRDNTGVWAANHEYFEQAYEPAGESEGGRRLPLLRTEAK